MSFPTSIPASRIKPANEAPVLRWGILGSGWIAERFIESVRAHTKQDIVAVGSRSKARAEEFASRMRLKQAYGDYDELVAAADLDVIYVATPHNVHHYGYDERIEVFGSKGMIESRRQRARGVSRYVGDKIIEDGLHAGWFERVEQGYYRALSAFAEAISKGSSPSPSLEDGLKAQLLSDKATESLKTGRAVTIAG